MSDSVGSQAAKAPRTLQRRVLTTGSITGNALKDGLLDGAAHASVLAVSQKLRERFPALASNDFDEVIPFIASFLLIGMGEAGAGFIPKAELLSSLGGRALRAHTSKVSTTLLADLFAMAGVALDGIPANIESALRADVAEAGEPDEAAEVIEEEVPAEAGEDDDTP